MLKHRIEIAACIGVIGAALLSGDAKAMSHDQCVLLTANEYLAAIERGACDISIETAAGPQEAFADDEDGDRDGRKGEGGGNHQGGNRDGGKTGGTRAGGRPGVAGKP